MRWIWLVAVSGCAWVTEDYTTLRVAELCAANPDLEGCPTVSSPSPTEPPVLVDCFVDDDNDGYGSGTPVQREVCEAGESEDGTDCIDTDADVSPGAPEICGNGIDDDCRDGDATTGTAAFADLDGDGFGDPDAPVDSCDLTVVSVENADDCDDTTAAVNPHVEEICGNAIDDDCDGQAQPGIEVFTDGDGDGFGGVSTFVCAAPVDAVLVGGDCDDTDQNVYPSAPEICGDSIDQDCDGTDTETVPLYPDLDFDGFGDSEGSPTPQCPSTIGYAANNTDCDDSSGLVNPDGTEICNDGIDQDCSGSDDTPTWWIDADGDGAGDANAPGEITCTAPAGSVSNNNDCDDDDQQINSLATEIPGSGIDEDCDGREACFTDADGDGSGDPLVPTVLSEPGDLTCEGPDLSSTDDDCNDLCASCFPGAQEVCSGLDNDCNTFVDDVASPPSWYPDADNDGFGDDVAPFVQCTPPAVPAVHVLIDGDCNDSDDTVFPTAVEICGDNIDQNCDGDDVGGALYWLDTDGDHQGAGTPTAYCSNPPSNAVTNADDCDDTNPDVYLNKPLTDADVTDPEDNDCDGVAECYVDNDSDTFGATTSAIVDGTGSTCTAGLSATNDDCDDTNGSAFPGGLEVVGNFVDEDCNNTMDCYLDGDRDGYGDPNHVVSVASCGADGVSIDASDCNDALPSINPLAVEIPNNGADENCDGNYRCYGDGDGDGFQSASNPVDLQMACTPTGADCNDAQPTMFPGNPELCDGLDNDCTNGVPANEADNDNDQFRICDFDCDDADPDRNPHASEVVGDSIDQDCNDRLTCFIDNDNDGVGGTSTGETARNALNCGQPNLSATGDDCDDGDHARYPGNSEICDGLDNDCVGGVPANEIDADNDTYLACEDCLDTDGTVYPGAINICDGQPNDCDTPSANDFGFVDIVQADGQRRFHTSVEAALVDPLFAENEIIKVCPKDAVGGAWPMQTLDPLGFRMDGIVVGGVPPRLTIDDTSPNGNTPLLWATSGDHDYSFRNLVIEGDEKLVDVHGGCLHMDADGSLVLDNVLVRDCRSTEDGGAVYIGSDATGNFIDSTFEENEADGDGGAVFCDSCVDLYSFETDYLNNYASNGGAVSMWFGGGTSSKFDSGTFSGNEAADDGGAIDVSSSSFNILNTTFFTNNASNGSAMKVTGNSSLLMYEGQIRNSLSQFALDINGTSTVRLESVDVLGNTGFPIRTLSTAASSLDLRDGCAIEAPQGSSGIYMTHPIANVNITSSGTLWQASPLVRSVVGSYNPSPVPAHFTCQTVSNNLSCTPTSPLP